MAKRKTKKKATRRRRRVGTMALTASNPLVKYGSMVGGFLLGDQINPMIDKVTGTMDQKLVGGATAGIGAALVFMKLGKKKTVVETVGGGLLIGAGAKRLLKEFGIMNGFRAVKPINGVNRPMKRMNGFQDVDVVNGFKTARIPLGGGASNVMGNAGYSRTYGDSGYRN